MQEQYYVGCNIRTTRKFKEKTEKSLIHLLYRILDLSNSKILHLEELRVLVINWGVSPKEAKEFFHQYALEKDTHGVDVDEFTEKLKPIWKYGIGSIWEAVVKMLVKVKFYSYKRHPL